MTSFDVKKAFHNRNFYRFTGPPENWLTAIKYMTWGLEEKHLSKWQKIRSGDVFLMHSMTTSKYVKQPAAKIVGLGVVGGQFNRKDNLLWIQEQATQRNIWPLLVPFSEIYLFSELPASGEWQAPGLNSDADTKGLIELLLSGGVPISSLIVDGVKFPAMGSISAVRPGTADELLNRSSLLLYDEFYSADNASSQSAEETKFQQADSIESTMRYTPSLKFLEGKGLKPRRQKNRISEFSRDNTLLERAEENHQDILKQAIEFFKGQGFNTWYNQHVDLLAEKSGKSYLVEVKSTLSNNFRSQARMAVGQLFEYEYFDVRKYFEQEKRTNRVHKMLMVSDTPDDGEYTNMLGNLKISVAWPSSIPVETMELS